jgi:tRNA(Ile)-lysidine synthetase-like protein
MTPLTFWKENPEYWISIQNQQVADAEITARFWGHPPPTEFLDRIIYLDQFMRHFSRVPATGVSEADVEAARTEAAALVRTADLTAYDETELYFCLMACKHVGDWPFIFQSITDWLGPRPLTHFPILSRFFNDTYRKAYTPAAVAAAIRTGEPAAPYDAPAICDSHPATYDDPSWPSIPIPEVAAPLLAALPTDPAIVSLSGGVDSMVMATLLARSGRPVRAVHIIYGNRPASADEAAFLRTFCSRLCIPLTTYTIEHLRRDHVDRDFYEDMTRRLRFATYAATAGEPVLLGHIREDIVENIWTNFAHGTHLDNLAKMTRDSTEEGIHICRPWLSIRKEQIYAVATAMSIPYLKNTTPSWSNRGKFRETFYAATHAQYGPSVDDKIVDVANALSTQAALLDRLLYEPIYRSWNPETKTLNITPALSANLDPQGWSKILTHVCHTFLHTAKPSIHACRDFASRVARGPQKIHLRKELSVEVIADAESTLLRVC